MVRLGMQRDGDFVPVLVSNSVEVPKAQVTGDLTVVFSGPPWLDSTRFAGQSSVVLTEEQYRKLFGSFTTDVPWYRPAK